MLYNFETNKVKQAIDCLTCSYFDKNKKKCVGGIGIVCYEYDPKTHTAIDPKTKLPKKIIE